MILVLPLLLSGCALDLSHAREDADACIKRGLTPGTHEFAACRTGLETDRRGRRPPPTGQEAIPLLFGGPAAAAGHGITHPQLTGRPY